jgi:hypothetical protein
MNCKTACFLIDLVLPHAAELDAGERHDLEMHLSSCGACAVQARVSRLWDERVGLAMHAVPVPAGLSASIKNRLRADQRRFLIRRRLVPLAAAAAVLFVAGLVFWPRAVKLGSDIVEVEGTKQGAPRELVNAWLKDEGYPEAAPADFNYNHLQWYGMVKLNHRLTPQLVFMTSTPQGLVHARVYILDKDRFDVTNLGFVSGNLSMQVWDANGVYYVVFFTGESLDPFFTKNTQIGA